MTTEGILYGNFKGKSMAAIWWNGRWIWVNIRSCFGGGYWDNDQPWDNDDGWDNG